MDSIPIGIDLGTTHSCCAVIIDGEVEMIRNEYQEDVIPSSVYFKEDGSVVNGAEEELQWMSCYKKVYGSKRMIGRHFNNLDQSKIRRLPFKVTEGTYNHPAISVLEKKFSPEQISSMIIEKLKRSAESRLEGTVKEVVLTIPTYFHYLQSGYTSGAANLVGLKVVEELLDPMAAVLTYGIKSDVKRHVLVFDLGGGSFDASIVLVEGDGMEMLWSQNDPHLGGEDFDHAIADFIAKQTKKKLKITDPNYNIMLMECEQYKKTLSEVDSVEIGGDAGFTMTRHQFEQLIRDDVTLMMDKVKAAIALSELTVEDVNDIILVGGSTRIPYIRQGLTQIFGDKPLKCSINPDWVLAQGAAIRAMKLHSVNKDIPPEPSVAIDPQDEAEKLRDLARKNRKWRKEHYGR